MSDKKRSLRHATAWLVTIPALTYFEVGFSYCLLLAIICFRSHPHHGRFELLQLNNLVLSFVCNGFLFSNMNWKSDFLAKRIFNKARILLLRLIGNKPKGLIGIDYTNVETTLKQYNVKHLIKYKEQYKIDKVDAAHLPGDEIPRFKAFDGSSQVLFFETDGAQMFFSNNLIITKSFEAIYDARLDFRRMLFSRQAIPLNVKKINGVVAYLSNTWVENYYHWMIFTLPLLRVYAKCKGLENIDYFYLGDTKLKNFHYETLELVGIPKHKIINEPCRADKMLMAFSINSFENTDCEYRNYHDLIFSKNILLRKLNIKYDSACNRKVFIRRGNVEVRNLANEEEIISFLKERGFDILSMDKKKVSEQLYIFSTASFIISTHGAALTNLMACKPGTKLIEIFHPLHYDVSYFCSAVFTQIEYSYIIGESADDKLQKIYLPVSKLSKMIDRMVEASVENQEWTIE